MSLIDLVAANNIPMTLTMLFEDRRHAGVRSWPRVCENPALDILTPRIDGAVNERIY